MSIGCHSLILKRLLSYLALSFQNLFKSQWVSTCFLNDPKWHFSPLWGSGVWRIPRRHSIMKWSKVIVLMPPTTSNTTSCKYQILPPAKLFVKGRYTAVSVCSENDNGVRNENMGFCGRQSTSVILVKCMKTRSSCLYKFQNFILTSTASEKSWISMGHREHGCTYTPLHHPMAQQGNYITYLFRICIGSILSKNYGR